MRKDVLIMLAGGFIAFLPFLGFPHSWDTVFMVTIGACVIALGIAVRRGPRPPMQPVRAEHAGGPRFFSADQTEENHES